MPYTDVDDLRLALNPGGVQDASTASDLSDDELADAILEAQAEVDARLSGRYTVPFPDGDVPAAVKIVTRDLAAYEATLRHRRFQPLADDHPVALRHARADKLLTALSKGESSVVADDGGGAAVEIQNPYDGELFTLSDFDLAALSHPPPYPWPYG
jgi:phage gp36-like protein